MHNFHNLCWNTWPCFKRCFISSLWTRLFIRNWLLNLCFILIQFLSPLLKFGPGKGPRGLVLIRHWRCPLKIWADFWSRKRHYSLYSKVKIMMIMKRQAIQIGRWTAIRVSVYTGLGHIENNFDPVFLNSFPLVAMFHQYWRNLTQSNLIWRNIM